MSLPVELCSWLSIFYEVESSTCQRLDTDSALAFMPCWFVSFTHACIQYMGKPGFCTSICETSQPSCCLWELSPGGSGPKGGRGDHVQEGGHHAAVLEFVIIPWRMSVCYPVSMHATIGIQTHIWVMTAFSDCSVVMGKQHNL